MTGVPGNISSANFSTGFRICGVRGVGFASGPLTSGIDMTLSNLKLNKEGDDTHGYRIFAEGSSAAIPTMFLVREGAAYKIILIPVQMNCFRVPSPGRRSQIPPAARSNSRNTTAARKTDPGWSLDLGWSIEWSKGKDSSISST